jgi:hypothetical protein
LSVFSRLRSLTLLAALALSLVGCKQGEGEVCDVNSDCETGFSCCGGGEPLVRGLCQPEADECADRVMDAGPTPDAGPPRDAGSPPDAGPADAGSVEDAGTDAGTVEDGGTDAGTVDDAGSDAGDGG